MIPWSSGSSNSMELHLTLRWRARCPRDACPWHRPREPGGLGRNEMLLDHAQIASEEGRAVVGCKRAAKAERPGQHGKATRRAARGDGEGVHNGCPSAVFPSVIRLP